MEKIQKNNLGVDVLKKLRQSILLGQYQPGTHLGEPLLAKQFGTSRGPVRDALQILVREGIVERLQNGRVAVKGFALQDVTDLFKVRYLLESFVLREWMDSTDEKSSDQLAAARRIVTKMKSKLIDSLEFSYLDMKFHESLLQMSGNKSLIHAWLGLRDVIHSIQEITNRSNPRMEEINDHHESIIGALEERNKEKALAALNKHLHEAEAVMIRNIEQIRQWVRE